MTCREFVELVTDYFDGALSVDDTARFEQHIADCFWCARYLEQMRSTINSVGQVHENAISPDAKDALLHAFRDWNAERRAF